jgi:nucleoid-associated protein YgaU
VSPPAAGELTKATLIDTSSGAAHPVMYNPEELKFEQGNSFAEIAIPGLDAPPVQYVRGKARTLSMELFFDSYSAGQDVRQFTAPIVALLAKQPQTQAPPILLFSFGRVQFRCVLVDAGQRYTMFLRDGTPVRSTISVSLHEYVEASVQLQQGLFFGSPTMSAAVGVVASAAVAAGVLPPSSNVHVVLAGDTLTGIAATYLGDPARWRTIADANRIDDPRILSPGDILVIPTPAGGTL